VNPTKVISYGAFIVPVGHESLVRFNNQIGTYFKDSFASCQDTRR